MNCPQCQRELTRVEDFWSCPKHGQVEPEEQSVADAPTAKPDQPPGKTKIFLSYARGDDFDPANPDVPLDREQYNLNHSWVARLYRDLTDRGFEVWFDRVSMPARNLTFHQEIRNAVQACDRLVLVVGPNAAKSDYVRQEWQFAWFAAEKVVTPILLRGQSSQPQADDITLLPEELKLIHCEDFRSEAQYHVQLEKLVRSLKMPAPPLGELIGVPSLPHHFLSRSDRLIPLRDAVRSGLDSPAPLGGVVVSQQMHGISASTRFVSAHGMGGIGKSVLASLLVHDRKVREAFPDGIIWIGLGSLPDITALMQRVHRELGGDGAFQDERTAQRQIKEMLADKAVLLVIDDAWRRKDVDAFDVLGPRCRALITSRDAGLVTSLGGTQHLVELLTDEEAVHLLAGLVGSEVADLPAEALQVLQHCGRLPLAVALAGGMVADDMPWAKLLDAFERHRLEFVSDEHQREPQHENLWKTVEISVQALEAAQQQRLVELAVFPEDEAVPEAPIAILWEHTGQLDDLDTSKLLLLLKQRSLIQVFAEQADDPSSLGRVLLHDVIRDYCLRRAELQPGKVRGLHDSLLAAYRAKCPAGWHSGPNDGYYFQHLVDHLLELEDWDELEQVLCDLRFIEAKCTAGLMFDLVRDYKLALEALPELKPEREAEQARERRLQEYGAKLIQYAERQGQGIELPEPPDTRPTQESMRRAEAASTASGPANVERSRSDRIETFANFVSSHSHQLGRFPDQTLPVGFNHASDGPVVEQAGTLLDSGKASWLRRAPRPLTPPKNPACLRTLVGHTWDVPAVALTPDGHTAVSGSWDKTLRVWDVATGERLRTLEGHTRWVTAVALTPDGHTAVSASWDNTLRVWDVATGELLRTIQGHMCRVYAVALTPDGHTAVSGSHDNTLGVWDVATGELLRTLEGHTEEVLAVALTPDGHTAVSGSEDKTLRVWDVATGECLRTLAGHTSSVDAVAFTPDGHTAVSASYDNTLGVWDVATGERLRTLAGHTDSVTAVALTPDGHTAVSASVDKTLRVWDVATGELLRTLEGHTKTVKAVALTPDGHTAVSASRDYTLRVWDVATGERLRTLAGHTNDVDAVALTPDGHTAVSGSHDDTLGVWDVATGERLRTLEGHTKEVLAVALTSDGHTAVSASHDNTLGVWDVATGERLRTLEGHTNWVQAVALTPDGHTAVSASHDNTLGVWDVATGELLRTLQGHTNSVNALALTPDGHTAVSGSDDNTLRVWDVATGELLRTLEGHTFCVSAVALTPDGHTAVSGSHDDTLRVWDVATGELLRTLQGHTSYVSALALTPDGHTAVSGSWDNTLRVWDVATGERLRTLEGHTNWVQAVALTPDGHTAVSGSWDNTLRVWDVATGELLRTLAGHTSYVDALALTPDGHTAVSGSWDKTLRVWDVATGELVAIHTLEAMGMSVAVAPDNRIVAGTDLGQLRFLTLQN